MLVEIGEHSQINLPAKIIRNFGIIEGDKFEVMEKDGGIFLRPIVVYPKNKIEQIAKIIKESEADISKQNTFDNIENLFSYIGIDIDNN